MTDREPPKPEPCPDPATLRFVAENRMAQSGRPEVMAHIEKCSSCANHVEYYRIRRHDKD